MRKIVVTAPGKVILFGEHAVVYGKTAVAVSLGLRTRAEFEENGDQLQVDFQSVGLTKCWALSDLEVLLCPEGAMEACEDLLPAVKKFVGDDDANIHQSAQVVLLVMYISIHRYYSKPLSGLRVTVSSDLPIGAGLGSSASFSVCIVAGLLRHLKVFKADGGDFDKNIFPEMDPSVINKWAFLAEKVNHGNPSGIDNSVCTFGSVITMSNKIMKPVDIKLSLSILLVSSGITRNTKDMVQRLTSRYKKHKASVTSILEAIDAISEEACYIMKEMKDNEDPCVEEFAALEELVTMNHCLLAALGVSHPNLNKICDIASKCGFCGKLTGAGGGGCVFILLPRGSDSEAVDELQKQLTDEGYECWKTRIGGMGFEITEMEVCNS